ncbi:pH regulation protein F [Isoptericola sp. NEAU-Y5]|uniref:PH regulation protein F n=1 Tax=Isoptericola luteus TaxID=2879484 RepID=A0ABS7ZAD5_9MICO|nr:monovalent cation/H+ antiporter complex subunit F [Isoptericola sp. NEAU-Y5]MCA5892016.1 pH regulation protein F [Isoptericola sp. NEAU-Y5]
MVVVVIVAVTLVVTAAVLALIRIEKGPSMLDRALGLDLLTASLVGAIAIEAAWVRRTETIPILVALSLVGFVGSVALSRFAAREPEGEGRVRSPEEVAAQARASDVMRTEHGHGGTAAAEAPDEQDEQDGGRTSGRGWRS